ncbi:mucoidy inhibitor MuiA family protein [Rhodophyticola porphyridii]|uniref:Mucoidy inhibitor MuiA family protein n=1 Tax=Rhodophyticola porphyridii TaxID=1852017 RepID=A0A3L9Y5Y2_9RHOB|nr:mucoidy inhibitor MuiA family protein [Rhodophyticola porphyridii]RMA42688.1 mucoidy inhibitor MuiA family protein [Rhodophyticola porphyridii]
MRFPVSALALIAATAAHADDIVTRADIARATVYIGAAEISRTTTITVPAGTHRVIVALPGGSAEAPQVSTGADVVLGVPNEVFGVPVAEGALDTAAQARARDAVDAAREAVQTAEDRIARADARIRGATLQIAYLEALARGGENGAEMPDDPNDLAIYLGAIGTESARVGEDLQEALVARRDLTDDLDARQTDLRSAEQRLAALRPFGTTVNGLAIEVTAAAETTLDLTLEHFAQDVAWSPSYEWHLDSETGELSLDRFISLSVGGGEFWQNVAVTFSTSDPFRQREPSELLPRPARIHEPRPQPTLRGAADMSSAALSADVVAMEPVGIAEETSEVSFLGLEVSYTYNAPVVVGATGQTILPLDSLEFETELTNRAVPRDDLTAFLVAEFENDSGEPILPGEALFFRDGGLIGNEWIRMISAGASEELAFGPVDHLRLTWQDLSLDEGDRGIFVQTNTQERRVGFTVENTSDNPEDVSVLYATPFAEQEDLDVDVMLTPQPTARDVDDLRGVVAWDITLAPGETRDFRMDVSFDWPEGLVLNWRP